VGVDLSAAMLAKAKERACYDALETAELTAYLAAHPATFDLIVSADTLVYFGDLTAVLTAAALSLRPGGHLIFTVEAAPADASAGFLLHPHGRYSHTRPYLQSTLTTAGLTPVAINPAPLRMENQAPVQGFVVTCGRRAHDVQGVRPTSGSS
jgi:predicted TPR repeat methyltransferase